MRLLDLASLKDAVELEVVLPSNLDILAVDINALRNQDALIDLWQTTRQEGAVCFEVLNADAVLFGLSVRDIALLR